MRLLTLTVLVLMFLCFSSCAPTWQYITLDSREVTKDTSKRFAWENDTLRLVYSYNGYGGPVWMSITNKTGKPIYVNWKKSAIIDGGYARSLFQSNVQMTGSFDARKGYVTTSGSMAGSFSLPEGMDFIPPGSSITKNLDQTISQNPGNMGHLTGSPETYEAKKNGVVTNSYKLYTFEESFSPVQFKTYLTFVLDSENAKEFSVSHAFYAREIRLTHYAPQYFSQYRRKEGDVLYGLQSKQ